ncbi:unnamed protein product [Sympodiomycopsis kandeliae]
MGWLAYLPVSESFGFNADLRAATGGRAFPQATFDHWELMSGDASDPNSKLMELVKKIRTRKGLKEAPPSYTDYYDRL